jgi:hypothetical protein
MFRAAASKALTGLFSFSQHAVYTLLISIFQHFAASHQKSLDIANFASIMQIMMQCSMSRKSGMSGTTNMASANFFASIPTHF